jgi:CRP-like cAMP-binding protein
VKSAIQNVKMNKMIQEGFLKFLKKKDILFWTPHGTIEDFPPSSILFYQNHFPIGLYILIKGEIGVNYVNSRKQSQIRITEPVILGFNHLLQSSPYEHSAETISSSQMIFVPRNKLTEEIAKYEKKDSFSLQSHK